MFKHMFKLALLCASSVVASNVAMAADAELGKAKVEGKCAECHEKADWAEENAASIEAKIKGITSGKTKHKAKLTLTDEEAASIAAYWAGK